MVTPCSVIDACDFDHYEESIDTKDVSKNCSDKYK